MNNKILIFDFDGTIADTFHNMLKIANRLSDEFHFKKVEPHEIEQLKDNTFHQNIRHLRVPIVKIPLIVTRAKAELRKDINSVQPIEGLEDNLKKLKSFGFKMGILTSNSANNVSNFLKNHDIELFDFIYTASKILGKNKNLRRLMNNHGFALTDVLYIGDEIRDIEAAKRAGIKVAAVTWGYNSKKALAAHHPDFLVSTPGELLQISQLK